MPVIPPQLIAASAVMLPTAITTLRQGVEGFAEMFANVFSDEPSDAASNTTKSAIEALLREQRSALGQPAVSLASISDDVRAALDQAGALLNRLFAQTGIPTDEPVAIIGGEGQRLSVSSPSPRAAEIENLINNDPATLAAIRQANSELSRTEELERGGAESEWRLIFNRGELRAEKR